jgi:NAD(P)-dependent dehydrogenase (short-subunit alcohol dehydrogenase family)
MVNHANVEGLVVAVTGGARGIGLAIATLLHECGAKVAIR